MDLLLYLMWWVSCFLRSGPLRRIASHRMFSSHVSIPMFYILSSHINFIPSTRIWNVSSIRVLSLESWKSLFYSRSTRDNVDTIQLQRTFLSSIRSNKKTKLNEDVWLHFKTITIDIRCDKRECRNSTLRWPLSLETEKNVQCALVCTLHNCVHITCCMLFRILEGLFLHVIAISLLLLLFTQRKSFQQHFLCCSWTCSTLRADWASQLWNRWIDSHTIID